MPCPYLPFVKVELNTIASSFGCMSALTSTMHRHLLARFGSESSNAGKAVRNHAASIGIEAGQGEELARLIPDNPTLTELPRALAAAHACYGKQDAVVLFVVQPGETNAVDQRLLEMKLWDNHGVRVVRMSLAEVRWPRGGAIGEGSCHGEGVPFHSRCRRACLRDGVGLCGCFRNPVSLPAL